MARKPVSGRLDENWNDILPRTIFAEADPDKLDKTGSTFTGNQGMGTGMVNQLSAYGSGNNIMRNPSRRFYDPEITTSAIYLPSTLAQKNRWCRWFYDHDELIGAVLDLHAELPYSQAEIVEKDSSIRRMVLDCFEKINFFSMLPAIDLEFMKIGEVFIHTPWDEAEGMWSHIIVHNPDFAEVKFTPFADQECSIELVPDDELKSIIHSTKPEDQQLKKRIPDEVFRKVLTGKNITLDPDEVTHIARRSNPYDIRGTSILNRIFRLLMYEDKLREAQITIADNFVYPLKIFKLGDPQKGWIPNETHQRALAQMLQQSTFDPNFSLIYHYGLNVEFHTVADKVMRLEKEWTDISEKKMIALGVGKQFLSGEASYASANVGLQTQLARYKAKRDLFQIKWINKMLRIMAERNDWYRRDKKELTGQYRVTRKGKELQERLIIPKLIWHKKLMMRDDQSFLTFMNNVYSQGKGPLSAITLMQYMGMDLEEELEGKVKQKKLESKIGALIHPSTQGGPGGGITAKLKDKFKFGKDKDFIDAEEIDLKDISPEHAAFVKSQLESPTGDLKVLNSKEKKAKDDLHDIETTKNLRPVNDNIWFKNIESKRIPSEVKLLLLSLNNKLNAIDKKSNGDYKEGLINESNNLKKLFVDLYKQGKLNSYGITGFYSIYKEHYSSSEDLTDYSDLILSQEFEKWIGNVIDIDVDKEDIFKHLRNLGNSCFCYGQVKGFQEQGIFNVKIGNVLVNDGLHYKTKELLDKGWNLSSILSPRNEIVMLYPCIEGYDDEFGNNIDPQIKRYDNFSVANIKVTDCPIEYSSRLKNYLNKVEKFITYNKISFVKDVIDLDEWEELQIEENNKLNPDLSSEMKKTMSVNMLNYDKIKKRGKIASFSHNNTLYISSWMGMEECSLTENFIKLIDIVQGNEKLIRKAFKKNNLDLSQDDIDTYKIFGYINPISIDVEDPRGYRVSENIIENEELDYKLRQGKIWDLNGKCTNGDDTDEIKIFKDNLRMWIDYDHVLNAGLKKSFEIL